ncbi:sulfatase [Halorubrum ezzemoulense]|nr:sulfatase [Halorubrum ezzemoulense]MDB2248611.1 sulfatase [Halorubrum ezzemoulense]
MSENVVILVMDTVRMDAISPSGSNLDTILSESTRYNQTFTSAPWTLPSHGSLFTGTTPSFHGAHAAHKHLDDGPTLLPEILQDEGYETVAVSNNTWISEEFGFNRGFETFFKTWQYVQSGTDFGKIAQTENGMNMFREAAKAIFKGNPVTNLANAIYGQFFRKTDDDGAARTNEWIRDWITSRDNSRPFFLFVNYLEPHLEYRPPKSHAIDHLPDNISYAEAMKISQDAWGYIANCVEINDKELEVLRTLYQAEISYLSEKIEEIIQLLKTTGEWENTLFIVTSDHGENIGDHGLMDHQYALYDTLLHVPLFVHGGPFKRKEIDDLVQLVDIPPTILDVLDIDASDVREQFQGVSFHPDSEETREYIVSEYMAPQPSMDALETRIGDLPDYMWEYDRSLRAIRTNEWKLIRGSDGFQELYNIEDDPEEKINHKTEHPEIADDLGTTLDNWLSSFESAEKSGDVEMQQNTKSRLEDLGYLQ